MKLEVVNVKEDLTWMVVYFTLTRSITIHPTDQHSTTQSTRAQCHKLRNTKQTQMVPTKLDLSVISSCFSSDYVWFSQLIVSLIIVGLSVVRVVKNMNNSGGGGTLMSFSNSYYGRSPFTVSQWQELEHQALIFKYMVAGLPVPPDLVLPIQKSFDSITHGFFHHPTCQFSNPASFPVFLYLNLFYWCLLLVFMF